MSKYSAASHAGNASPSLVIGETLRAPQNAELPTYNNRQFGQILSKTEREKIGLDTVHLTLSTTYADISPSFKAGIKSTANTDGSFDGDPCILYTDTSGRPIYGDKAIVNTENWQLTIVPCGDHANLLLSTSAKAFAENNVDLMDAKRFRDVTLSIEDELRERGLKCDLMNEAHLRRLDTARNGLMQHGSPAYLGLFHNVPTTHRLRPNSDGDTYFRLGAAGWQTVLYDKGQEQAQKAAKRKVQQPATKIVRGEVRFMTSKEVAKRFEVKKLSPAGLLKSDNFDQLPVMFRTSMIDSIFASERAPKDFICMNDETVKLYAQIQARIAEEATPGSAEYYRLVHHAMLAGADGIEGARRWYRENCADDGTKAANRRQRRFNQDLKRAGEIFEFGQAESSGMTRDELYSELKDAMLEE